MREASFGNRVRVHILNNAQNARCPEDCGYCSQSAITDAPLRPYPWKPKAELVDEAKRAYAAGAFRYCMVASGRGPTDRQVDYLVRRGARDPRRGAGAHLRVGRPARPSRRRGA